MLKWIIRDEGSADTGTSAWRKSSTFQEYFRRVIARYEVLRTMSSLILIFIRTTDLCKNLSHVGERLYRLSRLLPCCRLFFPI